MKTLIFALIFSFTAIAQSQQNQPEVRLTDSEINNKLISVARDIENERILAGIPDFDRCKQQFQFDPSKSTEDMRRTASQNAAKCFRDAVATKNNAQEIGQISDKLNLEAYKLIPSKSVEEITKYLSNKMYKSLTGIDYEEQDMVKRIQSLKFNKNKKIVDQKIFIELYKNQIAKNALTEVSRFCFENLRIQGVSTTTSFQDHWGTYLTQGNFDDVITASPNNQSPPGVTDVAPTPFGNSTAGNSRQDKDAAYREIVGSMFPNPPIPSDRIISDFFIFCGKQIHKLCSDFEKDVKVDGSAGSTVVVDGDGNAVAAKGSKACISKSRIIAFQKAKRASEQIIADFNTNGGGNNFKLLDDPNEVVKMYGNGQDRQEKSLNEITNSSSLDFFTATESEDTQRAAACANNGSAADCDEFVIVDDSRNKIQYNIEIEYTAKREAEIQRVKKLVAGDRQTLLDYLKANGYLEAAKDYEDGKNPKLEEIVGKAWEARKLALQAEIQDRLGKRQITQTESVQQINNVERKLANARDNAKDRLSERARLARVVFFNNIISSNLNLQTTSGTSLGRNAQALSGELDTLENQVAGNLFQNLRDSVQGGASGGAPTRAPSGQESITDISFLDQFLGGPPPPAAGAAGQSSGGRNP